VGYFTLSEKGLVLEANLTASIALGVTRGALVKRSLTNFILHEDQDIYYRLRKQLMETGEPQACELRMVRSRGSQFWARLEAKLRRQDADLGSVDWVVMSDITKLKEAEEVPQGERNSLEQLVDERTASLKESEKRYRDIFENANEAIFLTRDGAVIEPLHHRRPGRSHLG
jgi:PAS domain S-box-containing protein